MRNLIVLSVVLILSFCISSCSTSTKSNAIQSHELNALTIFEDLLRIDTSNPPGNETAAAVYIKNLLAQHGIESTIYEYAPGRGNLIARIRGNGLKKPILLGGHLDVVGVERKNWKSDPFLPTLRDGRIYGRGATDMKHILAAQIVTLIRLKKSKNPLSRDVIFVATSDEESASDGINFLLKDHRPEIEAEFAFNESVVGRPVSENGKIVWVGVQTTEKVSYNLKLTAKGTTGHSSVPTRDNPIATLSRALAKLTAWESPMKLNPTTAYYFDALGKLHHLPKRWYVKAEKGNDPESRRIRAQLHSIATPTIVNSGFRANVIPSTAEATVNCRLLPDQDWPQFVVEVKRVIGESNLEVSVMPSRHHRSAPSPFNNEAFAAIQRTAAKHYGNVPVIPVMEAGGTDWSYLRENGMTAYGFDPFNDPEERNLHGNDESLSLKAFQDGVEFYYDFVHELM